MSTTDITTPVPPPPDKVALGRYHLIVLAFFLINWSAQYSGVAKIFPYLPEQFRGLIQVLVLTLTGVNSGIEACVVPLGTVFIFSWLYLTNIQADVRQLYQIVVISILPLLLLSLGLLIYVLFFMKIDAATSQRLTEILNYFNTALKNTNSQQKLADPAIKARMDEIIAGRQQELAVFKYFWFAAAALSCGVCGHFLYKRLKLAAWKAWLIPATFAVSIGLVRTLAAGGSGKLMDRLKTIMQP